MWAVKEGAGKGTEKVRLLGVPTHGDRKFILSLGVHVPQGGVGGRCTGLNFEQTNAVD